MDLQTIIDVKNEIIYDLEARLDISNREQEQMLEPERVLRKLSPIRKR